MTPGAWHENGGMYKLRANGLWQRAVSNLPLTISTVISRKMTFLQRLENIQDSPPLLIAALKVFQFCSSTTGSESLSQMPKPSSINRRSYMMDTSRNCKMQSCSWMATKRLAIVGAGDIPIAMPVNCLTRISPKRMWLFFVTKTRASMRVFDG